MALNTEQKERAFRYPDTDSDAKLIPVLKEAGGIL